jgi:hypothetical protein
MHRLHTLLLSPEAGGAPRQQHAGARTRTHAPEIVSCLKAVDLLQELLILVVVQPPTTTSSHGRLAPAAALVTAAGAAAAAAAAAAVVVAAAAAAVGAPQPLPAAGASAAV